MFKTILLLFIAFYLHNILINHKAINKIEKNLKTRLGTIIYIFIGLLYILFIVWNIISLNIWFESLYAYTKYEIVYDSLLFSILLASSYFLLTHGDKFKD